MAFSLLDFTRIDVLNAIGLGQYASLFMFEVIDMIIMALVIGYIFSDYFNRPISTRDPVAYYTQKKNHWENIKYAALIAGIAVVLHELSHKVVAIAFGAQAILFAPYGFYLFAIILKAVGFPLIFFVGGFVSHTALSPGASALVALAGPLINFLLWGGTNLALKNKWIKKRNHVAFAIPFAKINLYLGIFNMIPIPGFDGWGFFSNIWQVFS